MTVVAIIQARMGSTRLPEKMLMDLGGRPVLGWVVRAAEAVAGVDRVAVATSESAADDAIAAWCAENRGALSPGTGRGRSRPLLDDRRGRGGRTLSCA